MAKPKKAFEVKFITEGVLYIYAIDIENALSIVSDIEGIETVISSKTDPFISVFCSPLYDTDEIKAEIEAALSPVPDAFDDVDID